MPHSESRSQPCFVTRSELKLLKPRPYLDGDPYISAWRDDGYKAEQESGGPKPV